MVLFNLLTDFNLNLSASDVSEQFGAWNINAQIRNSKPWANKIIVNSMEIDRVKPNWRMVTLTSSNDWSRESIFRCM